MAARLDFKALGPIEVTRDGEPLDLGPYKQRSLLALLLASANQVVSTDRLINALWGDEAADRERTLWVYISRLRSVLEPERTERGESSVLLTKEPGYVLSVDPDSVDFLRFEQELTEARGHVEAHPDRAVELLDEALDLWRGDALADFAYESFARNDVDRLTELRLEASELRFDARLRLGHAGDLVTGLEAFTRENPFRERPVEQLMLALYRSGRPAEALRAYERHRRMVSEELGIDPSPELRRLEEQILLHDDRLIPRGRETTRLLLAAGDQPNPYKGLHAFGEADETTFFGRDQLVADLLRRIENDDRLVAVVGPSGSGKSSAVRAGLIPRVRKAALQRGAEWAVAQMVPGAHPFIELEAALLRAQLGGPDSLSDQLAAGQTAILGAALRVLPTNDARLLLVIDQFEELFTLVDDPQEQQRFLDGLLVAIDDPHGRITVVLTLRADFYDRPLLHPAFGSRLGDAVVNVLPLNPDELEEAASQPAAIAGVRLEPALLARLIADVAGRPGALPMFQYTLTELYERRADNALVESAYDEMGGLRGAITHRAEELYRQLLPDEQAAARQLFLRLVTMSDEQTWSRRRVHASEIISIGSDVVALQAAIDTFGKHRLLLFDRDKVTGAPTVEVGHEALLTEWPRLQEWISGARHDLLRHASLIAAVDDWERAERNPEYLVTGARLTEYEASAQSSALELNSRELEFLDRAIAAREEQARLDQERANREASLAERAKRRLWALVAVVAALVTVTGLLSARASNESSAADFAQLISRATDLQTTQTDLALLLAAEAYQQNPGPESQRALLGALQNVEGTVEVWEAPRFPMNTSSGDCFNIVGPGQFVTQPNLFSNGSPDPGGTIVDIDMNNRTVHRIESSRLECDVSRSPRASSDSWLYVGSDNSQTTIVVDSQGSEVGSYPGFVRPFFDAQGRLLARSGEFDTIGEYVELDPLTGEVLSDTLFEANRATPTKGGKFISVIFDRMTGTAPDPSALLDAATHEVVVDLSTETGRAISGRTSADDSRFGYVSKDDRLLVWNTDSGELTVDNPVAENAQAIAFSPNGSSVVLLVDDGVLQIRSGSDGQITRTIDVGREPVMAIDWPQDDQIAVLRSSGVVDFVATSGGGLYETGPPCCDRNEFGFFVADGAPNAYAVYGNRDTGINTYLDVVTGEEFTVDVSAWVFDEIGADMHTTRDKTTVLIRPPFEIFRVELDGTAEEPHFPFGDTFVLGDDVPDHLQSNFHGGDEFMFMKVTEGSISPGFRDVVLEELQIGVINIDTMEIVVEPNLIDLRNESPKVRMAELLPGGTLMVGQDLGDGQFRMLFFTAEGERFLELVLPFNIGWWRLTPDRRYLLTADPSADAVQRWDVETGESVDLPVRGMPDPPDMLSDGRFLIQTRSGQYEMWDIEAGAAIGSLADAGPDAFTNSAVHPDETHVWIRLNEAWTKIPLDPQRWLDLACEFAGRSLTEAEWRDLVPGDRPYRDACAEA